MEALEAAARKEADRNLAAYARRRFPDRLGKAPAAEVDGLVRNTRAAAKTHGFEHEHGVAILLDLAVMYGAEFDKRGWCSEILAKNDLPAAERAALLRQRLIGVQTTSADTPQDGPSPQAVPKVAPPPPPAFAAVASDPPDVRARSPLPPGPPSSGGKLATLEDAVQFRDAEVEKVSKFPPAQRNRIAAIAAAINLATGQVALGFKIHGQGYGKSAEEMAIEAVGGKVATMKATAPIDPRTKAALVVSRRTRKTYLAEHFADGTAFEE
jgi:hypothetical protein